MGKISRNPSFLEVLEITHYLDMVFCDCCSQKIQDSEIESGSAIEVNSTIQGIHVCKSCRLSSLRKIKISCYIDKQECTGECYIDGLESMDQFVKVLGAIGSRCRIEIKETEGGICLFLRLGA